MAYLSLLKFGLNGPTLCHTKMPFSGSLGRRVQLGQAAPLYCRISTAVQTCARQERDLRAFAKKAGYKIVGVWNEIAPGPKQERAERKTRVWGGGESFGLRRKTIKHPEQPMLLPVGLYHLI